MRGTVALVPPLQVIRVPVFTFGIAVVPLATRHATALERKAGGTPPPSSALTGLPGSDPPSAAEDYESSDPQAAASGGHGLT